MVISHLTRPQIPHPLGLKNNKKKTSFDKKGKFRCFFLWFVVLSGKFRVFKILSFQNALAFLLVVFLITVVFSLFSLIKSFVFFMQLPFSSVFVVKKLSFWVLLFCRRLLFCCWFPVVSGLDCCRLCPRVKLNCIFLQFKNCFIISLLKIIILINALL